MAWDSQLTPQEKRLFSHLFQLVSKTQDGIVTGSEAVQFFATSGVPTEILSEIWEAADRDKVGSLTPETFAIALKLIACAQHGKEASVPILATHVPLPQFEGVIAPSPLITNSDIPITAAEREKYGAIFRVHQPANGAMDAETARNVFLKSKLSMDVLGQIWTLADVRQSGTLSQTEFTIAMHYIAKLMDGSIKTLPDKLPSVVFQSASGETHQALSPRLPSSPLATRQAPSTLGRQSVMTPPQRAQTIDSLGSLAFGGVEWDVTAQEKQQFNTYFDKIDSGRQGSIQGKEAVEFFKNSRLAESELAHIWDLSDIQQRGSLSRDEFAVAMHLIHKRLKGENLPQVLPKTLVPPSQRQNAFASSPAFAPSPAFASPAFASPAFSSPAFVAPAQQTFSPMVTNDLLGDFGDDQIATETNQMNQLQNKVSSMTMQTNQIHDQKESSQSALEQLIEQKKQLETQMTQVKMTHETAVKDLNELQEKVRREESEWDIIRGQYTAAQEELVGIQNEAAQVTQQLENGRAETESLRRRIVEIQQETQKANQELERLRGQGKQQTMMLDINKRQVTAAEQDRSEAERNLREYKETAGIVDDQQSVVNTPNLDQLFATPTMASPKELRELSPMISSPSVVKSSPFDEFTQETSEAPSDFDAIFGTPDTSNVFDPTQWPTSPTKNTRGPPPPPPQSRHHRQPSIGSASSGAKKQRAPPPPPPPSAPAEEKKEDDFEAAFSDGNQLSKATVKDDDAFADFDDAFSSFDKQAKPAKEDDWVSAFEPFKAESSATTAKNDDWDSVFGVAKAPAAGFDDSFSSFADDFGKSNTPSPVVAKTEKPVGIVGDKIQDLVKMGFAEHQAKEALNRYDQDLEKASNFLLDQAK